ncbi:MAG: hypothetical protein AAGF49_17250 [Pseudomonadota bacterium]
MGKRTVLKGSRLVGLLMGCAAVAGCSSVSAVTGQSTQMVGTHSVPQRSTLAPVSLFSVLGEEAETAALSAQQAALDAPEGGVAVPWSGGAATGTVTPGPVHMVNSRTCRDIVHVTERSHERLSGRSTMCRNNDGSWTPLEPGSTDIALTSSGEGS